MFLALRKRFIILTEKANRMDPRYPRTKISTIECYTNLILIPKVHRGVCVLGTGRRLVGRPQLLLIRHLNSTLVLGIQLREQVLFCINKNLVRSEAPI